MKTLAIDLETFSTAPIGSGGVYRYAADEGFDILLFAYSEDGGPVHLVDLASGDELPPRIRDALTDPRVEKWAFNAQFERVCLSHWLGIDGYLDPAQWRCSMVWASALGLPRSLKHVAETLKLDAQKLDSGTRLINFFCEPVRLTETQQASLFTDTGKNYRRRQPTESPDKWKQFCEYNIRDVEVENQLRDKLSGFPLPEWVWDEYALDQRINDRGIRIDADFAQAAINADEAHRDSLMNEAKHLTGLDNPGSPAQLKTWLEEHGCDIPSLAKADVAQAITTTSGTTRRVLELRQELSRSSTKKYEAMLKALCPDGRAHGLIQYYGAGRTGRWAGRLIQVQNLPRNYLPDLDDARQLVKAGEAEAVELLYGSLPDTLSQLIRTAFVPREGTRFIVADYSAIEARVLAWLAGEAQTLAAFAQGKDLYCETASSMFGVPVEKGGVNGDLRAKGKVATLACIAEGQKVLTHLGEVPIENITTEHRVWDGEDFVTHQGVINKGVKDVITYQGLTATPDHLVWVQGQPDPIPLRDAAARGAHLVQTGDGRRPVRLGGDHQPRETMVKELQPLLDGNTVHQLRKHPMDEPEQPAARDLQRLPALLGERTSAHPEMAGPSAHRGETTLHQPERPELEQLRCPGDQVQLPLHPGSRAMGDRQPWPAPRPGARPDQQRWPLRAGEPALGQPAAERREPTLCSAPRVEREGMAVRASHRRTEAGLGAHPGADLGRSAESRSREAEKLAGDRRQARVFDLLNAGPRHRFTVAGRLVHNCGYQGGVGAIKAMGGEHMGLDEQEMKHIVDAWRQANPNITQYWWDIDQAAKDAITTGEPQQVRNITLHTERGMLFITLPSGRRLAYAKPAIGTNRFGGDSITCYGIGTNRKFEKQETYGGKLVENITQAVARDLLSHSITLLENTGHDIVMHIHDEVVIEAPPETTVDEVCDLMSQAPQWADGIPLTADGYECNYYMKDD